MRILVHEFVTGGGLWTVDPAPRFNSPLAVEAIAMVCALCTDLRRIPNLDITRFQDSRVQLPIETGSRMIAVHSESEELDLLTEISSQVDGVILIAPETDNHLSFRCELVQQAGGSLLSPDSYFVRLTADKQHTASRLSNSGIRTPESTRLEPGEKLPSTFPYPAVLKPNDGVGSQRTQLLLNAHDVNPHLCPNQTGRLERYCEGLPASVAALCGPSGTAILPACEQSILPSEGMRYLGGRLPLDPPLAQRARNIAESTISALPSTRGYVGIDMVLGNQADGSRDFVLEVNPRLTTSYAGLSQACHSNLAEAMIQIAQGAHCPLSFTTTPIRFDADGRCVFESQ